MSELQLFGCQLMREGNFMTLPSIDSIDDDNALLEDMVQMQDNMELEDRVDFKWIEIDKPSNELLAEIEEELFFELHRGGACIAHNTFYFWLE